MTKQINIVIIDYPGALQSAVMGLKELFLIANEIVIEHKLETQFTVSLAKPDHELDTLKQSNIVIIPPSLGGEYFQAPDAKLLDFLSRVHREGTILCSACAGAFILAKTGILNNRSATTHWNLANRFKESYPKVNLNIDSLLINDGDIISAGGLMSWIDLGLEIVAQFTRPQIMRALGKFLIVDTCRREQRYYNSFTPTFTHGNPHIVQVQHYIQENYHRTLHVALLADLIHMSERTFLRQFSQATTLKPIQYIQRIRVQKACELLETTTLSFEKIALNIGYSDANSLRKIFLKVIGLSPSAFKARFV